EPAPRQEAYPRPVARATRESAPPGAANPPPPGVARGAPPPPPPPPPPIWLGVATPDSAERAGRNGCNVVSLSTAAETRVLTDRYRKGWRETNGDAASPQVALGPFIAAAERDAAALALPLPRHPPSHRR